MTYKDDIQFETVRELKTQIGKFVYFSFGEGDEYYAFIKKTN